MILGALVDAGLSLTRLRGELKKIPLSGYKIVQRRVKRGGISATKIDITIRTRPSLKLTRMIALIRQSRLAGLLKTRIVDLLNRLGKVEAKVHGKRDYKTVHLHELGSVDTLLDISGTVIGLHLLGAEGVFASALPLNRGVVMTEHGRMPIPAPATAELLQGFPVFPVDLTEETVTPTGALLITALARPMIEMPLMSLARVGYGAGERESSAGPNLLRVFSGESLSASGPVEAGQDTPGKRVWVLETNIDDSSPEIIGYLFNKLFKAKALDVFTTSVQMKKSRPALLLTVLARQKHIAQIEEVIYNETTTFGVRRYLVERDILERKTYSVRIRYGKVRVKVGQSQGQIRSVAPEYEDCRRIAESRGIPLKQVYQMALEGFKRLKIS